MPQDRVKELPVWVVARAPKTHVGLQLLNAQVQAHTRSEARAAFKRSLSLSRLPVGVVLARVQTKG